MKELISNLKRLRVSQGKDQATVSVMMDYELSSSLSHIENGNRGVSSEAFIKWFSALDIDLNNIVLDAIDGLDFNLLHKAMVQGIDVNTIIKKELEENE